MVLEEKVSLVFLDFNADDTKQFFNILKYFTAK